MAVTLCPALWRALDSAAGQLFAGGKALLRPAQRQAACVCVCVCVAGGPGLQVGLDFCVHVLTLRVFSIKSVAEYY